MFRLLLPFLSREHTRAERRIIAVTVIGLIALFKYPLINQNKYGLAEL
jgi:hypothetical protein